MTKPARSRAKPKLPNGHRAVMASRRERKSSLDFYPTPPWATRALRQIVFYHLNAPSLGMNFWDPACGEGHIIEVLFEYTGHNFFASDIHDYGWPGQQLTCDFFEASVDTDWIITNPPFGKKTLPFVLRALDLARKGVAVFLPLRWLEGIERYEKLFKDKPPTLFAPFVERVPICKGRWDPDKGTATAYCWLVWLKDAQGRIEPPRPTFWIPPGQRKALSRPDDRARFAAWSLPAASTSTQQEAAE